MCELFHSWVTDTQDGTVSDVVSEEGIELGEYFDGFRDGEGYSSPFVVRLYLWIHTNFGEIEVVVVVFMSGLDIDNDFADILGIVDCIDGDSGGDIFGLHDLNDNNKLINT
jgi:hypothetical protein